jgi:hypothetical protein
MVASPVTLNVYDLSQGMARQMSPMLLGKQLDGIWHTGIVAFSTEYYFGGGICADAPARTPYGTPVRTEQLGTTRKTKHAFVNFLASIASRFSMMTYHVLDNNCNNFSDVCARFLLGENVGIPNYIIDLPQEAMSTPLGAMLRPMLESMQGTIRDQSLGHEVNLGATQRPQGASASTETSRPSPGLVATAGREPRGMDAVSSAALKPILLTKANRAAVVAKLGEFYPKYKGRTDGTELRTQDLLDAERSLPTGSAFPALDLLRLAAAQDAASCVEAATALSDLLSKYVLSGSVVPRSDRMMALRVAVNCFAFEAGASVVMKPATVFTLSAAVSESLPLDEPAVTKTAAALAFNMAGACKRHPATVPALDEESKVKIVYAAVERIKKTSVGASSEEAYPLLGAIAVASDGDPESYGLVNALGLDLTAYLDSAICTDSRTSSLARHLKVKLDEM